MSTTSPTVDFDPFEEGFTAWPYDQYRRLRETTPVLRSDLLEGWMLTRYDDVSRLLRTPDTTVEIKNATPTPNTEAEIGRRTEREMDEPPLPLLDEPGHTRVRRLMAPPFRARAVRDLRPIVERQVAETLDALVAERGPTGEIDVLADYAYPLPVTIFCELLGVPAEDGPKFREWCHLVALNLDPMLDAATREHCMDASDEMRQYLSDQMDAKRADPGDDILSDLVHYIEDGEQLTHGELLAQVQTLYIAGHEPTTSVLSNGMYGFMQQPDELARLRAEPDLLSNTVLELLRWDGPNQFVRRIAATDIDLGDAVIPAGDVVYPCIAAANHDPAHFGDDADRIRIDRPEARDHLQLGAGIHACLGTHMARMLVEVFLGELLARFPRLELAGEPTWMQRMVLRSVGALPLRYASTA